MAGGFHRFLHQRADPSVGADLGCGEWHHDDDQDRKNDAAKGFGDHGKSTNNEQGKGPAQRLWPCENTTEFGYHQAKSDEGAEDTKFLEHVDIADAGLLAFAFRKFCADEHHEENDRWHEDESERDPPIGV